MADFGIAFRYFTGQLHGNEGPNDPRHPLEKQDQNCGPHQLHKNHQAKAEEDGTTNPNIKINLNSNFTGDKYCGYSSISENRNSRNIDDENEEISEGRHQVEDEEVF